ncbi:MAG: autotransporter domain-containing protein [Pseudomonadota bacterium]
MNRHYRRRAQVLQARGLRPGLAKEGMGLHRGSVGRRIDLAPTPNRRSLLHGTALASTLLLANVIAPTPAIAVVGDCAIDGGGQAVQISDNAPVLCDNVFDRYEAGIPYGISIDTNTAGSTITVTSTGELTTGPIADDAFGIFTDTVDANSDIDITNSGNVEVTTNGNNNESMAIFARATGGTSEITIDNSGYLEVRSNGERAHATGIDASTYFNPNSPITIENNGDVRVTTDGDYAYATGIDAFAIEGEVTIDNSGDLRLTTNNFRAYVVGIDASTNDINAPIDIHNSGEIRARSNGDEASVRGINARTTNSEINIRNSGNLVLEAAGAGADVYGIYAETSALNGRIDITNSGDIHATAAAGEALAIYATVYDPNNVITNPVSIDNTGDLTVLTSGPGDAHGISVDVDDAINNDVTIHNTGNITLTTTGAGGKVYGIYADVNDAPNSPVTIRNSGDITAIASGGGNNTVYGIYAEVGRDSDNSPITIDNTGDLTVISSNRDAYGIYAKNIESNDSEITVRNSGDIVASAGGEYGSAYGIYAKAVFEAQNSPISIYNTGDISVTASGSGNNNVYGIFADTSSDGPDSPVVIHNTGNITGLADGPRGDAYGILVESSAANSSVVIHNKGDIAVESVATDPGIFSFGISSRSYDTNSPVAIENSGSVYAKGRSDHFVAGVFVYSQYANPTTITNSGEIGASSHRAIDVEGAGTAHITNAGLITGFVDLTHQDDKFVNQSGGVFETKKTSFFGAGSDLFRNQSGGTVLAATNASKSESSTFEGLERFENAGLISLQDGGAGDSFTMSNTPGGTDLKFVGKSGSTLAIDTFLDGPASATDTLTIEGGVSGVTWVDVNNTNSGPGTFNPDGIPVVFVTGNTPAAGNFQLSDGPIDTGFFNYDLFFQPTGSGQWELRSFVGGGAYTLPKLLTASQDMWHQTSATWFDRTADLRVVLNRGAVPAYDDGGKSVGAPFANGLTPGVWLKGGGAHLDRDDNATTRAFGRNYTFDVDGEFDTFDLQVGADMGQYDVLAEGDVIVFGVLGGFVGGDLDFDALGRGFDFSGGQIGAYATYLNGGLFVDTLVNVHLYEINTPILGFPDSLDATTVGLRSDAGYRFGSFTGGVFFEPLATIEVIWADIDGFSVGGNTVSFSDDANVRGRLGGRVGTTMQAWEGTTMEPFLIASVWGNLSEDNSARLVSNGTTFTLDDDLDDVWGELSAGVNLFNFAETTSVFAKVDYTFAEDVQGIGGKGGIRVAW